MNVYGLSWAGYWLGLVLLAIVGLVCPAWWWAIPGLVVVLVSLVGVATTYPATTTGNDDNDDVRL